MGGFDLIRLEISKIRPDRAIDDECDYCDCHPSHRVVISGDDYPEQDTACCLMHLEDTINDCLAISKLIPTALRGVGDKADIHFLLKSAEQLERAAIDFRKQALEMYKRL